MKKRYLSVVSVLIFTVLLSFSAPSFVEASAINGLPQALVQNTIQNTASIYSVVTSTIGNFFPLNYQKLYRLPYY